MPKIAHSVELCGIALKILFGYSAQKPNIAQIAQSVEQRIENPRVGGSIPPLGTIDSKPRNREAFLFLLTCRLGRTE